jgi:indole-3-glycerol phosphate synthase
MILLIVACLSEKDLFELYDLARKLGLHVLIEVHSELELETALKLKPQLIGINNRDLNTFKTDLSVSMGLIKKIPKDIFAISESGIKNREHLLRLQDADFSGALVGESLLRSSNLKRSVMELIDV